LLVEKPSPRPFSGRVRSLFLLFVIVLTGTVLVFQIYSPWKRLVAGQEQNDTTCSSGQTIGPGFARDQ